MNFVDIKIGHLLLALVFLIVGGHFAAEYWHARAFAHAPGVLAPRDPIQENLDESEHRRLGGYNLTLLAKLDTEARVLSARDYRHEAFGDLIPLDLALGWGPMSNSENLDQMTVHQSDVRTYGWHYDDAALLPSVRPDEISHYSANMHMIPANDDVRARLFTLHKGDVVRFTGYLVNVRRDTDGAALDTSTSRDDTGIGSCEIVLVESVFIHPR